jgi:hypothetical protein
MSDVSILHSGVSFLERNDLITSGSVTVGLKIVTFVTIAVQ